jgi:hypothetical protein
LFAYHLLVDAGFGGVYAYDSEVKLRKNAAKEKQHNEGVKGG